MYSILDSKIAGHVMIVAVKGGIDWAAYSGMMDLAKTDKDNEQAIAAHGSKLYHDVARELFPELKDEIYRR